MYFTVKFASFIGTPFLKNTYPSDYFCIIYQVGTFSKGKKAFGFRVKVLYGNYMSFR